MYFNISRKISKKTALAYTILEVLVASSLFGVVGLALGSIYLFSTRTFAAMANYATLDQNNRNAMDRMTKEIRECRMILSAPTNSTGSTIYLRNNAGDAVTYAFDGQSQRLTRTVVPAGSTTALPTETLIPNCQVLSFTVGQRTPDGTNFDVYPMLGSNDSIQVLNMTWKAWKAIPGSSVGTSEEIQTAHVVIRNQHYFQSGIVESY